MEKNTLKMQIGNQEFEPMEKIRAPNFSMWLCSQKRRHKFKWKSLADYLFVSCQCVDSYANGRAHPQLMRFYAISEFIAVTTNQPINNVIIKAMASIKKDHLEKP